MHRSLALLALLAMGSSQLASSRCEMRSAGVAQVPAAAAHERTASPGMTDAEPGSGHGEEHASHGAEDHEHRGATPDGCGLLMACGAMASGAPSPHAAPWAVAPTGVPLLALGGPPLGVVLASDPPPPRDRV